MTTRQEAMLMSQMRRGPTVRERRNSRSCIHRVRLYRFASQRQR